MESSNGELPPDVQPCNNETLTAPLCALSRCYTPSPYRGIGSNNNNNNNMTDHPRGGRDPSLSVSSEQEHQEPLQEHQPPPAPAVIPHLSVAASDITFTEGRQTRQVQDDDGVDGDG